MTAARRLNELLNNSRPTLDRILAVVASVDPKAPPTEASVVKQLDDLAQGCPDRGDVAAVVDHVFGTSGFTGDRAAYYSPDNSLIHRTIHRGRGIPLTLAAVASEVGRRLDVDLRPIGMPGHVLLGAGPQPTSWFDPFNGGAALSLTDCRQLFGTLHSVESFSADMLRPMTAEDVVVRTLNNLRVAYVKQGDLGRLVPVLELRVGMDSSENGDRMELARLLAQLGRFDQAADHYRYLVDADPERAEVYRTRLTVCLAHRN